MHIGIVNICHTSLFGNLEDLIRRPFCRDAVPAYRLSQSEVVENALF